MVLKLSYINDNTTIEVGIDEAGAGAFSAPVYAAAVIWPKEFNDFPDIPESAEYHMLDDSKKISPKKREQLRVFVENTAIEWAIGKVSPQEIDTLNIRNARILAMHRALDQLLIEPDLLLIDGDAWKSWRRTKESPDIEYELIEGGDGLYQSIAAASILAKTYRDNYMKQLDQEYPVYQWASNKGYGSSSHRKAIVEHGLTEHHRKTFIHPENWKDLENKFSR